jgi:hypothetical protein
MFDWVSSINVHTSAVSGTYVRIEAKGNQSKWYLQISPSAILPTSAMVYHFTMYKQAFILLSTS